VDADGYPTEAALDRLANWPHPDFGAALDFAMTLWHWPDAASHDINAHEAGVLHATPEERYVRFATGGWSGNEAVIAALRKNFMIRAMCWRLSASGGLHIYRYPPTESPNG
jgi:hypothetical protein